jgi:hypothetical protein
MALALRSPATIAPRRAPAAARPVVKAAASVASEVPDMNKRNIMNLILLGGVSLPAAGLALPYAVFFYPPRQVARQWGSMGSRTPYQLLTSPRSSPMPRSSMNCLGSCTLRTRLRRQRGGTRRCGSQNSTSPPTQC